MDPIQQGKQNVQNAFNTGNNAVNSFDPTGFSKSVSAGQNALYGVGGAQNQQSDQYIQAYKDAIKANPTATSLYNTGNEMFNVPTLAQNATTLNNAVLTAPQTTLDTAKGFNYDNNQVQNQTNLTLGRLSPLAAAATNQAQTAEGLASGYVNAGMAQNAVNLQPVQTQGQQLAQLWAQQATGFDQNAQNTLNGLVAKMQSGVQLSQSEMQQYASLAAAEENYNATINSANIANQFKTVAPGNNLVNTFKNTIINPSMLTSQTGAARYG